MEENIPKEIYKLDALDKKIIGALNKDVRASYTKIAKEAYSSKEVVRYRIKRLEDLGIIKGYITVLGLGYWSYKLLIQFQKISNTEEKKIIDYLTKHDSTSWVTPCMGNWDIVFVVMAKDPKEYDQVFREIMQKIGNYIQDYKMSISVDSSTFGHSYILGKANDIKKIKRNIPGEFTFDEKDKLIARELRVNARVKLVDIANKTKIPVDTIKYRIKQLEQNHIIKRYRLILDTRALGYQRYEIFIRCINLTDEISSKVKEFVKQSKNVEYFGRCVGSFDITLTVHFKTSYELRNFMLSLKKEFGEHIKNFESLLLFDTQIYVNYPKELK